MRREFRLQEGDPFNSFQVKRSKDRIQSLGYFQEKFEIDQKPGSTPDRVVLEANLEEKPTGSLSLSAGFSSLERFIVNASIEQNNFRGLGQTLSASVNYSQLLEVGRAGLFRAVPVRPQHRARRQHLPPRPQPVQLRERRQRPQHDLQPGFDRLPAPAGRAADRISCSCRRATPVARRCRVWRRSFSPNGAVRSAAGRPLPVRRDRQRGRRRRSAIRWSIRRWTTAFARHAAIASCSTRISPVWAAASNISRRD